MDRAIDYVMSQMGMDLAAYLGVVVRIGAMMLFMPLLGSGRIPRRVKGMLALVMAVGMAGAVPQPVLMPPSIWELSVALGGEILFGLAMGMTMAFVFIAAQWAGELIGQQMGFNLSEVFDPQFGQASSLVGELYFMLTLVVFILIDGHHAMLRGVYASLQSMPLLSVGVERSGLDLIVAMFRGATELAMRLAGPMLITMLIVDFALGCLSKTMPQFNLMSAGLSIRSLVGLIVLIVGMVLTMRVVQSAHHDAMEGVSSAYSAAP